MASQHENLRRLQSLKIDGPEQAAPSSCSEKNHTMAQDNHSYLQRPSMRSSAASLETIRATPPMNIPNPIETAIISDSPSSHGESSYMDHYMRTRKPSISFSNELRTDFGHRQSINEPLPKPSKEPKRGRYIPQDVPEERAIHRSRSESTRDHYDPMTGRHLPGYSTTPPREQPHIGEGRFPLLQRTVDDMARESQLSIDTMPMSLTSQSTMSPAAEEVQTPRDEGPQYPLSPLSMLPNPRNISTSLESPGPRSFRRTASQRWRDGEGAQDFFSRASSLRKPNKENTSARSMSRHGAAGTASSGNSNSVASSFLRSFSINSGDGDHSGPLAVDAEGQTIGEDYVLGKQIGFGGFSTIKEVTQISAESGKQRKLAVKIVRRNIEGKTEAENDTAQAEFDHEVELWRFLNHPNVLPLEAVYKLDEAIFCFIPLNTGGTLFDLIRTNRQGVPIEDARNYAYQLASALRYLHLDAHVVHRDVKLENCLIETTNDGPSILRLCDFGMADWLDSDHDLNSPGSPSNSVERPPSRMMGPADTSTSGFAGGSLEYAPPEIVRIASMTGISGQAVNSISGTASPSSPRRSHISAAVDMWAFGVCLYTMVVGKRPFNNTFMPRVVMAILAGDWDHDLLAEKANGDEDLIDVVNGCLAMDERNRWDARTLIECQWFEEERAKAVETQDNRGGGWRL